MRTSRAAAIATACVLVAALLTATPATADAVRWSHLDGLDSGKLASGLSSSVAGSNLKRTGDLTTESWWGNDSSWNRYSYVENNPLKYTDPIGKILETLWDATNVVMGVGSLGYNVWHGNWGAAALDAGGVVVDVAATATPFVPGGAGTAIKAGRAGARVANGVENAVDAGRAVDRAADAARAGDAAADAARGTDYVVTSGGEAVSIPNGATGPHNPQRGSGMVYDGGSGGHGMDDRVTGVRIMDANQNQGRRVNYMNQSGQTVDPVTGRTISNSDPRGHIPLRDPEVQ